MEYTLGILFNRELSRVLLLNTNHGPYPSHLNGIGGKLERKESSLNGMYREAREELEIPLKLGHFDSPAAFSLVTMQFPSDVTLYVYALITRVHIYDNYHTREGELMWFPVDHDTVMDVRNSRLAGEGNVAYFINAGRLMLKYYMQNGVITL